MLVRRTLLLLVLSLLVAMCSAQESKIFIITGEVNRAGQYDLKDGMHIVDAINLAGGLRDFADRKKITIVRSDKRIYFDYDAYLRGEKTDSNLSLENRDTIVVR